MQQPKQRQKRPLSPIWILPLLALCIGGWLYYKSLQDAGIEITVHFDNAQGISAGKTKVIYKGIDVGTVQKILIDDDLGGVNLLIEMDNRVKALLVKDTAFWIVKPEVSAGQVRGLETLIGGTQIGTQKGLSSEPETHFIGLDFPPPLDPRKKGLRFTLVADSLYSLERGSKIYTKNFEIGRIEDYTLQENGKALFQAYIQPEYVQFIKKGTRFWNSSGLSLTGNLRQGLTVNMESIASLLYGGITCDTPDSLQDSDKATQDSEFTLYKDFEEAEYGIHMTLQITSGEGIVPGKTEVQYRGLKAGVVKELIINKDQYHTVTATVLLDPRTKMILRENTKFWVVKPEVKITGITNLSTLIGGNYITFIPGDGAFKDSFIEEADPMPHRIVRTGKSFKLVADDLTSLKPGAPIYNKKLQVGEIKEVKLNPKKNKVAINIFIYAPYDELIRPKTVFWNASGIAVDGQLSNLKIRMASLETVLAGGISFVTPKNALDDPPAQTDSEFELFDNFTQASRENPELLPAGLHIIVTSKEMNTVTVGSPVLYKNIKVGEVIDMNLGKGPDSIKSELLIQPKYSHLVTSTSRFYTDSGIKIDASLQGVSIHSGSVESIVSGGISFINSGKGKKTKNQSAFPLFTSRDAALHADYPRLNLTFGNGNGISKRTGIYYQGIKVGGLESIQFDDKATQVIAKAYVEPKAAPFFRKNTKLYLVRPQVKLSGIENMGTILSGPYIDVCPGTGAESDSFAVHEQNEIPTTPLPGMNIVLEAPRLGSLSTGSPVYFRQIEVGKVTSYQLAPKKQAVWINVNIVPEYSNLVYTGSKFWKASGFRFSGGIMSGFTFSTESMQAVIKGGLSLATPEGEAIGLPAKSGDHFQLAEQADPEWLKWQPELPPPEKTEKIPVPQVDYAK